MKINDIKSPSSYPKNQKPKIVTDRVPGKKSREWREREDRYLAPGLQGFALMANIVIDKGEGSLVTDIDGNQFLDFIGGIGVGGLGYSHPKYVKALSEQMAKSIVGSFTTKGRVEFLEKLQNHLPSNLSKVQLYSSGAEAVESALRLAKNYTGKFEFVSFYGAFHGKTMGPLSLMGSTFKESYGPLIPGNYQIPYADCYRCPFKSKYPECGLHCVEFGRKHLKMSVTKGIAAFIMEPMQGTAGNIVPPSDFVLAVKELAKEFDALFIADEMITGFGRSGKFFGIEHSGVECDIMTIGKQFAGGVPASALITTEEISKAKPWGNPSGSSSSYGGNPLVSVAAATAIQIIEEEGLVQNSADVGEFFLSKLLPFKERFSFVGDVRGRGLFVGLELVEDKKSKTPLRGEICRRIFDETLQRGLLTMSYSPHFRMQPAMTIDKETAMNGIAILEEVFKLIEKEYPHLA